MRSVARSARPARHGLFSVAVGIELLCAFIRTGLVHPVAPGSQCHMQQAMQMPFLSQSFEAGQVQVHHPVAVSKYSGGRADLPQRGHGRRGGTEGFG
jgi:hypothetical protein